MSSYSLAFLTMPGMTEWLVIGFVGLLIFGKRLPEVGRSLGKGILEFKRGLQGLEADIDEADDAAPRAEPRPLPDANPATYKFDPYTGQPLQLPGEPEPQSHPS
jgi:sec-independent protein translocase protein TatA